MRLSLAALLALPVPLVAQQVDAAIARHIDSVFAAFATTHSPGCAVAVTRGTQVIFARGYGMASLELNVPITPRTVMDIGSVSKQFTAASILMLQQEGKLSLDDDVRKYLPQLPDLGHKVTLRHLITHTSGWRDYSDIMVLDGWDERDRTTDRDAWEALERQRALNFVPGATYRYSNTGFFVLGEVVKKVSGRSLAEFVEERIFKPLGMTQTVIMDHSRMVIPDRAVGYSPTTSGFEVEMSDWEQVGDGSVQTSVSDLAKWLANFETGAVGGKALQDSFLVHGRLNDGSTIAYTAGLSELTYRGVQRVGHTGSWAGYRAALVRFPKEHIGIVLTCNRSDAATASKAYRVSDALVHYGPVLAIAPAGGEKHDGFYAGGATGATYTFSTAADTLFLVSGAQRTPLARTAPNAYANALQSLTFRFARDQLIATALGDVPDTLARTEPLARIPTAQLAVYAGTYASPEIAGPIRVTVVDSALVMRLPRGDDLPLTPVYRDAFESDALPAIYFVRNAQGRVVAVEFTDEGIHELRLAKQP
jgi:CubicO group peptidase (beta-lactamase class C family)